MQYLQSLRPTGHWQQLLESSNKYHIMEKIGHRLVPLIILSFLFTNCSQKNNSDKPAQSIFAIDTNKIAILPIPKSESFTWQRNTTIETTLSQEELLLVEELLNQAIASSGKENGKSKSNFNLLSKYKRQ